MKIHMVRMVMVQIDIWTVTTKTFKTWSMNRYHQLDEDEYLSVFDGEEYDHQDDGVQEEEGTIHDDGYTEAQYTACSVVGMYFHSVQSAFAFCKEHSRLTYFGIVKKSAKHYISGRSSLKQFVEKYEVALKFKYEKEMESQASKIKQLIRPTTSFDWDMHIYSHYTRAIYDFFRVHNGRLPYCEIERHVDFDVEEGVEIYLCQSDDKNGGGSKEVEDLQDVEVEDEERRKIPT
ncbi:hypothetical protein BC332_15661 [Capsicum chinense]|nr:hypothetical protein BC332_15661 [Capsicum chinense]